MCFKKSSSTDNFHELFTTNLHCIKVVTTFFYLLFLNVRCPHLHKHRLFQMACSDLDESSGEFISENGLFFSLHLACLGRGSFTGVVKPLMFMRRDLSFPILLAAQLADMKLVGHLAPLEQGCQNH